MLNYTHNRSYFGSVGQVFDEQAESYRTLVATQCKSNATAWRKAAVLRSGGRIQPPPLRVAVDISSMTRQRIADTMLALYVDSGVPVDIDWLYAPAAHGVAVDSKVQIRINEPIRGFEGWGDPADAVTCVVGAGFEGDLALGVIDELEPADTWIFKPLGYPTGNGALFDSVSDDHVQEYRPEQPYRTLLRLDSLVGELVLHKRVVILPLGPKIFALLALIIGLSNRREVVVWRLSADSGRIPFDQGAAGPIVGLRASRA